jgi:outer membrane assembly lipoprotein YfiO
MGLLFLAAIASSVAAQQTSELQSGRWVDVASPTTQPLTDPQLNRIEDLVANGRSRDAMKSAVAWLKANKESKLRDRGLFLMAEALYHYGDRIKSFYYLDELMDEHPDSPLFGQALEKQYQIADAYINGYRRRVFWLPLLSAREEGIEILFRIQQRSPRSQMAEKALLRTADYYYADSQYDLAADAYRAYSQSYPRSPYLSRVKLRQAYSNLAQFRGLRFDATPVVNARAQLQDIVAQFPDLAKQENIPEVLSRIDNTFARKLAVTANFYERTHEPRAAAYTYDVLIKNYPNSAEADDARRAVARLNPSTRPAEQ